MTFPTKFSERMRAAMFPQQNLKRREAAFLLGATAFRTREMQKCASPFVEVRQIEFLARETPNCTLPRTCTHIPSMDMRERERFASQGAKRRGRNPQRCYDPSDDRDGTAGVPSTQPVLVREPTSAFSSLGRLVLSSMLDAKEQGAQRPEESTIIPFSESRYRSSDAGRAHLQTGEAHLFISAIPSGGYSSLYFASQSRSASTAFVRTKCGTHVLDGDTPYPVIRTKDSAYNGNLWRVPITAQSSTDATDHDALQPLRGSEADCVRSPIRQSIPSRPQHRRSGGRTAPEEMGRSPIFDKRG